MIPLDLWNSDEMKKRRENAVAKALKEKPPVKQLVDRPLEDGDHVQFYEVKNMYTVRLYRDPDDQFFIECGCVAGSPPLDEATGLPSREAVPCYHAASVLLHIAEKEKENESDVRSGS